MQAFRERLQKQPEAGPSQLRDSNHTSNATPLSVATPVSTSSGANGPTGSSAPYNGTQGKPIPSATAEVSRKERFQKKKGKNKADPQSSSDAKGGKLSNAEKAAKKALKLERKKAAEQKRIKKLGAAPVNRNGGERTGPKNLQEQRRAASRAAPWVDLARMARCDNPGQMLNEEVSAFYQFVSPTREEFEVRLYLIELITRAIRKLWPDAIVTPFGSWQTQLYLPSGDIDLVVEHHNVGATKSSRALHLGALGRALREANITDTVAVIANAKVPIIKFVTLDGRINVDISLNQTNGIASGKIINQYLDVIPGSRQLIMVIKSFLSQRSMNEVFTGGLGSYAVICMVISFLQVHPQLRSSQMDAEKNLGTLLVEFFELYGRNFNYDYVGLSIRRGGFYFDKRARGWLNDSKPFLLSVEDPQDPDSDIGGGSFGVRTVRGAMAGAFELLTGRMFERSTQMAEIHAARGNDDILDDLSILSAVMGFSPDVSILLEDSQIPADKL
ncbi:hypothetical protein BCR39DRAFT_471705 [Naematelia encephala]|uniref:polynucleotide adenylyltransferase n=1 Tax=Naematelia encephala TaxID=71784 RepID=A0A1Y2ARH1_9TREE|nr:hypothetical protein BCR39DRAFT_471705 [Naematelia encephala]